ncbi:MAG: nitronate monooxygenase [Porticoccaceae bacterium]|nr:nitronate monooxygenase [Pseudomonadales bacterium]MCP5172371.1 nitronate monooxygenase [Pseudomonadales bacterium]
MSEELMIKTPITEMFNIQYPIICGAMMWLGVPQLCEVVADAGGMGTVTAAIYKTEQEFRAAIVDTKRRLDGRSFMVGVTILPSATLDQEHYKMYLRVCAEEKVPGVEVSGQPIDRACSRNEIDMLKNAGVKLFQKLGSLRHALHCEKVGYDGIYAAGFEEGGHPLNDDVTTMVLTPRIAEEVSIPVVTVGGIADGRTMAAALTLGASGVMMATRFLATTDCCEIHDNHRAEFVKRQEYETEMIAKNLGLQCRALSNGIVKEINVVEAANGGLDQMMPLMTGQRVRESWVNGDVNYGVETLGQSVGLIKDIPTTAELLERMAKEALASVDKTRALFQGGR